MLSASKQSSTKEVIKKAFGTHIVLFEISTVEISVIVEFSEEVERAQNRCLTDLIWHFGLRIKASYEIFEMRAQFALSQ